MCFLTANERLDKAFPLEFIIARKFPFIPLFCSCFNFLDGLARKLTLAMQAKIN